MRAKPFEDLLSGVHSATIAHIAVLVREVRVRIGVLSKYVTIRIYYDGQTTAPFTFAVSHVVKTAKADARENGSGADSENEALRKAVRMLTQDYEDAVRRGEMPDDAWLVAPAAEAP